jgi:hypothetical protein
MLRYSLIVNFVGSESKPLKPDPVSDWLRMNKTGSRVRLVAGFLPRGLARLLVQEGEQAAYAQAQALGYLHQQDIQVRNQDIAWTNEL